MDVRLDEAERSGLRASDRRINGIDQSVDRYTSTESTRNINQPINQSIKNSGISIVVMSGLVWS